MKAILPLLKNVLTFLAKCILMLLGLTAAASATDALFKRISTKETKDSIKIVKSFEESGVLIRRVLSVKQLK